jgi:hypothetical protein
VFRIVLIAGFLIAVSVYATPVTISFGVGTGLISTWTGTSNASEVDTGVSMANPILLHAGGSAICDQNTTADTCGTGFGLSNSTAYGAGGTLTMTLLDPDYTTKLLSFSLTGFSRTGAGDQQH